MANNWLEQPFLPNAEVDLKIKTYAPGKSPYKPRISESLWNSVRPTLEQLHKAGKKRREMLDVLVRDFDFCPSRHQLNVRMANWGFRVHKVVTEVGNSRASSPDDEQRNMCSDEDSSFNAIVEAQLINSAPTEVSNNQDFSSSLQDIFRDRLIEILRGSAPLHHSEWVCVLHDVIDFLKHSLWYKRYSDMFLRYLMHIVESKEVTMTIDARLVIILDCLQWPTSSNETFMTDWAYDRLVTLQSTLAGPLPLEFTLLFLHCCIIGSKQLTSSKDWSNLINRTIMTCPNPNLLSDYEAKFIHIFNPVLHSCADIVTVEHNFTNQGAYLNHDSIGALLFWCEANVGSFASNCNTDVTSSTSVNVQFLRDSYTDLSQYFIRRWIEHTHKVNLDLAAFDWSIYTQADGCQQCWSDLVLFRAIARTLAFLSILIITKAREYLFASTGGVQQPCQAGDMLNSLVLTYRAAIQELEWDHSEASWQPSDHAPPALGDLDDDTIELTVQRSVDHATSMAYESYLLRQEPGSTRHRSALNWLPCNHEKSKGFAVSTGVDTTLSKKPSSTSSSFRSFRRAGIKPAIRSGLSSTSGKSSAAFPRGSIFSIAEWSSTVFDEQNTPNSEVMLPEI